MPKSVEEILAHADEYAKRFEEFEPSEDTKIDLESFKRMRAAIALRQRAERELLEAVRFSRSRHVSWAKIGAQVGTSGEAARQKYASLV